MFTNVSVNVYIDSHLFTAFVAIFKPLSPVSPLILQFEVCCILHALVTTNHILCSLKEMSASNTRRLLYFLNWD